MKRAVVLEIICALFMLLFMYAATAKLFDYDQFRVQLGQSPLLTPFVGWLVWAVPAVEIGISLMLLIRPVRLLGLYASFTLMVMFTAYIVVILNFSSYVPCSCGGILENLGWTEHLIFNIGFTLLALAGIILQVKEEHQLSSRETLVSEPATN